MKNLFVIFSILFLTFSVQSSITYERGIDEQQANLESAPSSNQESQTKGASFLTVGGDNFCDIRLGSTKIQDAIDTGVLEIRIALNSTYLENLIIHDKSVTLRGGYADCTDASNGVLSGDFVTIDGSGSSAPVIKVSGATQRNTITLEYLILTNGTGSPSSPGGGISAVGADAAIFLTRVNVEANTSTAFGGGIGLVIGSTNVSMVDSLIRFNSAKTGGGLSCIGANNSIVISGVSGVSGNSTTAIGGAGADGKGGGVFLGTGCQLDLRSGTVDSDIFDLRGIFANLSKAEGGGIYAESGAQVFLRGYEFCIEFDCDGDNTNPVSVTDNSADFDNVGSEHGGGIYATGANTLVFIASGLILNNDSSGNGGGVAVLDQASLVVKRLNTSCWDKDRCNLFAGNSSGVNNGIGGAIYNDNANVDISASYFERNRADFGTAIYTLGNAANTRIEGSIFNGNGNNGSGDYLDQYVMRSFDGTSTEVLHSTFADNKSILSVFGISANANSFKLHSSIVDDAGTGTVLASGAGGTISIDCILAHEIASLASGTHLLVGDPQFIDRNSFNYHIDATTSAAVDYCNNNLANPQNKDVDNELFGWDDPNVTNIFGPYDIGADETYENDVIFSNDFE